MRKVGLAGVLALLLAGAALAAPAGQAPVHWPSVKSAVARDPKVEARIERQREQAMERAERAQERAQARALAMAEAREARAAARSWHSGRARSGCSSGGEAGD